MSRLWLVVLCAALAHAADLVMLKDPLARCMDGTQGGYYFSAGSNTKGFIIHLEGGGECASYAGCHAQLSTSLGSSKYFPKSKGLGFLNDASCSNNPDFCDWTHVQVAYCSQDLHSGLRTVVSADTFGLYFSGGHIFNAVIDDLVQNHGLAGATDIIISGDSAGGIASWLHVDALADRFPSAHVAGAPIAGFYFYAWPYTGPNHTQSVLVDFRAANWPRLVALWNSTADESCVRAIGAAACMLANYSFPYIASRTFVTESQSDKVVLLDHDSIPEAYIRQPPELAYVTTWSANMTSGLAQVRTRAPRNGLFSPACFIHTDFYASGPKIAGRSYLQVLGDWYFGRSTAVVAYDTCGVFCNPTCPQPK
eukprot:m.244557 g.244557  ORF g.244557 m.244557 type:complete len:366 (+) comp14468_c0_seq1:99-1196(+)